MTESLTCIYTVKFHKLMISLLELILTSLLVTMDVEALYTNIDHMEGLDALSHYLEKRHPEQMPPSVFILQLAEWTLHNNVFLFQNQFFKQKKGSAMGACFAPNYSNLFMGAWEETFVYSDLNIFWTKSYGGEDISMILSYCGQVQKQNFFYFIHI